MSEPIKRITIVGKDADAWITALFLKSGLNKENQNVEIELIEIPSSISADDFYSVLPSVKNLHKVLGAHEENLVKSAKAQHFFAQKFVFWNPDKEDFKHAYEKIGINFNSIDFYQYWLKATEAGLNVSLHEFCLGANATKLPSIDLYKHLLPHKNPPNFGYNLSAQHYIAAIARATLIAGVKHRQANIKAINTEAGSDGNKKISSITLADDSTVRADLFIDASGSQRVLINPLDKANFIPWSETFLCDRVITTSIKAFEPTPSFSLMTAFSNGWYGLYPLQNRTGMKICYSSKYTNKTEVLAEVSGLLGVSFLDLPEDTIMCGMLQKPWVGNCIAVGNAVATLDQNDALDLQPLLLSLVELRGVFPTSTSCQLEADIYARRLKAYVENLSNFQLAHYLLNGRQGEQFWDACRNVEIPQELQEKIALFIQLGHISIREYDTFLEESWTLLFNGHGLHPEHHHPMIDKVSDEDLKLKFMHLLKKVANDTADLIK